VTARAGRTGRSRSRTRASASAPPTVIKDLPDPVEAEVAPRTGAKRTVLGTMQLLPSYVRLLVGLVTDKRVAIVDKLLVAGAVAYILSPLDLIPDFIPFLGQVDDVYLLMMAVQRLLSNAGKKVLADHWTGPMTELSLVNVRNVLSAAAFFLPRAIRRRLRRRL
jgi:uncharacterized membrane protein YkvA (DUF1232 family)